MLWESGELFVKVITTFPAFAVKELVLYFSWPSGSAARLRAPTGVAGVAGVEDVVAAVEAVVAGAP
jgi:hypothetical protein